METVDLPHYSGDASKGPDDAANRMMADKLVSFASKFISEQKPLDEDAARILEEHFWDCV